MFPGDEVYTIANKIGVGAFAKVYSAGILNADDFELEAEGDGAEVAIKVESPPCAWEFYISQQLQVRTKELDGIDVVCWLTFLVLRISTFQRKYMLWLLKPRGYRFLVVG